jgi:RimJ/RimL family protein N-acetyltransferase
MQLVPFVDADIPLLCSWFDSERAVVQWGGPDMVWPLTPDQVGVMLAEARATPPQRLMFNGVVDGAVVAHGQVHLDHRHGVARFGRFAIAPKRRGQGLAEPFVAGIIDRAFAVPGVVRLELAVYTHNTIAMRLYEKMGFVREGVRRSSLRVGDERWDTALYAIVRA